MCVDRWTQLLPEHRSSHSSCSEPARNQFREGGWERLRSETESGRLGEA